MNLNKYLKQPFPSPRATWYIDILYYSLFVSFFLLIFDPIPFDLPYKKLILIGFGFISYFTGALLHLIGLNLFPKYFYDENWSINRHLVWFAIQLFFIGISNHIYSGFLLPFHPEGIEGLLLFEFRAFSLGIIPITVQIILTHNYLLSKNLKEATEINNRISKTEVVESPIGNICLIADNEKDSLELKKEELYFIESIGNYIQVYYHKNNIFKNIILRCSLKKAESFIAGHTEIAKCHRAFIVNMLFVTQVKGNSQGYRLVIMNHDKEIPVARNYAKDIKKLLESMHTHGIK
jgi:DNA-binding LytR/AlgR family response regulator